MDPDNVFETALHEQTTVVDLGPLQLAGPVCRERGARASQQALIAP